MNLNIKRMLTVFVVFAVAYSSKIEAAKSSFAAHTEVEYGKTWGR